MIKISFPFNYGEISKFKNLDFFKNNSNIIKEVYTVPFFLCEYKDALTDFGYRIDSKNAFKILNEINSYGIDINVTFTPGTNGNPGVYTVTIDSTKTLLTEDLEINFFKYDNNLSTLVVVVNGVSTTYYTGTVSVVVPANNTP